MNKSTAGFQGKLRGLLLLLVVLQGAGATLLIEAPARGVLLPAAVAAVKAARGAGLLLLRRINSLHKPSKKKG
ncbi:hypothetical protein D6833_10915 [Candidatus Parcubacteria bacterium]|nr:MAG: hypothetical protein D6833_10915 [Candidatus Parcubacteria bacterium]